jgi:hypothetical protein
MMLTSTTSTGHLAMSQIVTAVEPTPTSLPTCSASPPVTTTAIAETASRTTITSVMRTCCGRSFQNGRPSPTS